MAEPHENLTRGEARDRAGLVSEVSYRVRLDLTGGDETFGLEATVGFDSDRAGADTFLDLTAATVHEATLNGEELPDEAVEPTRLRLEGVRGGANEVTVAAEMHYQHEGRGLHHFRDPADDRAYLHSQFEPFDAHLVYPCFDQPDIKAPFDLTVDAPADWAVVSNERVLDRGGDGDTVTWDFDTTPLLPPYLTAVIAGGYESFEDRHGDTELGLYVRRSLAEHLDVEELFAITRSGLDWFADAFGMAYPFDKYDQLFVPEFSAGAMENPGCVTFNEAYVFRSKVTDTSRERRAETLLHEMAHMWFGDLVTMRWWDDLWLNESFATFMSVLSQVDATRFTNGWVTFLDSLKAWAKYQDQLPTTHPIAADMHDIESVHQNFDGITYAKGASVLRQLVAWVGQDQFLAACRGYFREHAWDNAELADFLGALEDASGRDLDPWSREWLQTTGVNTLTAETAIDDGHVDEVAVHQDAPEQHPTLRRHRVAVGIYDLRDGAMVRTHRAEVDLRGERTVVEELSGAPAGRMVLVNDDDLTYAKIRLDERSTDAAAEHLDVMESPLARAQVWSATWDMVRDARLPARRYAALVMSNAASETEVGVLERLQARARGAALRYGAPANRRDLLEELADDARERLAGAGAGSDHQLAWAKHWASCARRDEQLAEVRAVLDGQLTFDGLEVDTELRWHLVESLAAAGAAGTDLIDAELERDPTDLGERHAATARAARPVREAKEQALEQLLEDDDLSHTMARQLWGGVIQLDQPEVLAGFDDRYLQALDRVWDERSVDWAIEFTEGMFPHPLTSPGTVDKIDAELEREDLGAPRRRALLEQRDIMQRALRAREVDRG